MAQRQSIISMSLKVLLWIIVCSLVQSGLAEASESGNISGSINEKESGNPVSGAKLIIIEKRTVTHTDTSGSYGFGSLPPGKYTISVAAEGYISAVKQTTVEDGGAAMLDFSLEPDVFELDEILVRSRRVAPIQSKIMITNPEIRRIPGTGGDALWAIQTLPGISTNGDFSGQLYVRGGGPEDNSFYFDRVMLFYPYHFGGFSSTLNSEIIRQVDVYAGGFDAEYGDAQAIIDISSRSGKRETLSSTIDINMLMAEGLVEGKIGVKGAWYLAGRRSYIDLFPVAGLSSVNTDSIIALPRFWDYQTKLTYLLGESHNLIITAFGADDFMKLRLGAEDVTNDPELAGIFHWRGGFHSQGATIISEFSPCLTSYLTLSHNYILQDIGLGEDYFLRSKPHIYSLRTDTIFAMTDRYSLEMGFGMGFSDSSMKAHFIRSPGEEEETINITDAEKVKVDTEDKNGFGHLYTQLRYTIVEPLSLTIGGRGDYYGEIDEFVTSPRASLSLRLPNNSDLNLSYGKYMQPPDEQKSSPDWGNPGVSNIESSHFALELERQFPNDTLGRFAVYYKQLDNLITSDPEQVYLNQGEGLARGMELFLRRRDVGHFFGWLSYSYSRSERKSNPDEPWRLYSYDQTHVVTTVANYKLTPTWEIGAKWRYTTGQPYTPVLGAERLIDPFTSTLRWIPIYGERNSERLRPYHRLDLRISKAFIFAGANATAYFEIMNAYNHKNLMSMDYNSDYSERKEVYSLPIVPYFGITANF